MFLTPNSDYSKFIPKPVTWPWVWDMEAKDEMHSKYLDLPFQDRAEDTDQTTG